MRNTSNQREIIVDADTNEGRDIPRDDAWTVARVVGRACVKHRVAASPCFHSHSVLFERPFTLSSEVYFVEHSELHLRQFLAYFLFINQCITFLYNNINLFPDN